MQARYAARRSGRWRWRTVDRGGVAGVTTNLIMLISNIRENGKPIGALPDGEMFFHSDLCYTEHPVAGTMLYSVEVPRQGGNTLFADQYAAYETLPAELKARIEGRRATNRYEIGYDVTIRRGRAAPDAPAWTHPMVRIHPRTGRKALLYQSPDDPRHRGHGCVRGRAASWSSSTITRSSAASSTSMSGASAM